MTSGMPMDYVVIIEKNEGTYGAYVPDLPGCVAAAPTRRDVMILIRGAIELHLEGFRQTGVPIPAPESSAEIVRVAS